MADGSVKIEVGLDVGKAEKKLANLKDKISKAEDQLNKTSGQRDAISERLDNAAKKAETARQKIAELNEELSKETASKTDTKAIQDALRERDKIAMKMRDIDVTPIYAKRNEISSAQSEEVKLQEELELLQWQFKVGAISEEDYRKKNEALQQTMQAAADKVRQLKRELETLEKTTGYGDLKTQMEDIDKFVENERQTGSVDPEKAAEATGVILWDRNRLERML